MYTGVMEYPSELFIESRYIETEMNTFFLISRVMSGFMMGVVSFFSGVFITHSQRLF